MERFLTNYPQKRKAETDSNQKGKDYEKSKRKREFIPSWTATYKWLQNGQTGMTCNICALYDKHGTFVTGCQNYNRDSINQHEKSESHKVNVIKFNGQKNPENSEGAKALRALNQLTVNRLMLKFRNVFALCKKGRPYTDYPMLCDLDESKGLDIGTQYRTDKKAAEFASFIAKAEVAKIAQDMKDVRFISAISDGSTDSSYQEAEIVFVRHCHKGDIKINFSLVKNIPKADADSISKVIMSGMKKFDDDYAKKIVACGTDGASVMLGSKTGAVQRIREAVGRPWLIAVHCSGHKLELAFKDTIKKKINLYDKISLFLLNIYYFYRNSCLNRAALKDSFKILNQTVILPTRTGGTRWMAHLKKAIECFLKGYDAITQHLNQLQNPDDKIYTSDKGNKAKFFLKVVNSKSVWYMLHFLMDVLTILVDVSKLFQEKTATISRILVNIEVAVEQITKLQTSNGPYLRKAVETAHDHLKGDLTSFESARRIFTTNILSALNVRFVENPGILKTCGVLDLLKFPLNTDEAKDDKVFNKLDKSILKEAYSGVLALLIEAAKFDAETATLSAILEECKFTQDRIDILLQLYQEKKLFIQILLGNIGTSPPHIVDVDWRLDYYIKSNQLEKVNEPVYLISLKTEVPGKTDLEEVQFSCSLEQLQDFVGKLKDATKCLEKIGQV